MTTKSFFSLLLVSCLVLISCKKELEPQESSPSPDAAPAARTTAAVNSAAPGAPGTPMQMQQNTTSVTTAPPVVTPKGMNPPHGQPGHRCDISVGAPLNSPVKAAAPPAQPQMTTQITQSGNPGTTITPATINADGNFTATPAAPSAAPAILQAPVETAAGMNPPHGQEGHVCGTPVGSPLPK